MKTLIELYDERPIENVLSAEVFHPERVVYLCPRSIARDKSLQEKLRKYYSARKLSARIHFVEVSLYHTEAILKALETVTARWEDCAVDIAGGTETALFACGAFCTKREIPVFTYSRRRNRFYNISHAEFVEQVPCTVRLGIDDCFLMAGGDTRTGRVDNRILEQYEPMMESFFRVYMSNRKEWAHYVSWFQLISQGETDPLTVSGRRILRNSRGLKLNPPDGFLRALEKTGMISELETDANTVAFRFRDAQCRAWLRDVGSVLELETWKGCRDSGAFQEVRTSVIVDWLCGEKDETVSNELDVVAVNGLRPVFVSCKTCEVKTEALNELAILRDRFGGEMARAAIVTTGKGPASMRRRAEELNITVIDVDDLRAGRLTERLASLAK